MDIVDREDLEERMESAEIPKRYTGCRFENFDTYSPKLARNVAILKKLSSEKRGVVIFGPVGCGKTHLGTAMLVSFILAGARCGFTGAADYVHRVQGAYGNAKEIATDIIGDRNVILLDDLGSERGTETARASLLYLVDQLYCAKKRIIVTSNFSAKDLYGFEPRLASRLGEMSAFVELDGEDFRLRNAAQRQKADRCKVIPAKTVN
jgi:DNA replication protein DnaC